MTANTKANGYAHPDAPGDATDQGVVLQWQRDRRGGKVVVMAMRGGQVVASERVDVFSDAECRKVATAWCPRLFIPVDRPLVEFRSIAGQVHAADQEPKPSPSGSLRGRQELSLQWPEPVARGGCPIL